MHGGNQIHHMQPQQPSQHYNEEPLRAQTSQAIKSFDGNAATSGVRNTSSSNGYAKSTFGASGIDPLRRKTTHIPPSAHQSNQRRLMGAGELVKVGQKLTSENHLSSTVATSGKTTSFISTAAQALHATNEEEKSLPTHIAAQSSVSLHPQQQVVL